MCIFYPGDLYCSIAMYVVSFLFLITASCTIPHTGNVYFLCVLKLFLYVCVATGSRPSMKHLYLIQWESEGAEQDFRLVNRVSSKWKQFGRRINLEEDLMTTWDRQVRGNAEECWDMVMQRWLKGERHNYPLTWEGLFKLLKDVAFQGVVPDLKHAVESAASQGMYIVICSTGGPCVLADKGGWFQLNVHYNSSV